MPFNLPAEAHGIRLCRVTRGGDLLMCETVIFEDGMPAVDTILRRANITVTLDAKSYKACLSG